ncbi:TIGR02099 family protein [Vibrio sp. HA2012]|uniref:YhdP family protein n=1 Tax=Vibrio sp. HA2012 TaxID=1971595 RepID=UPI000C2B72DE|nr:YhdP family protein [Vibrio sp. HA2012]PJC85549.1 TIGR02099 family protein [Vibrio sp. HA2012]
MTSFSTRLGRIVLWKLVIIMVLLALAVTTLRIALPRLDRFQSEIETWATDASGLPLKVGHVTGFWRNTHPFLSLQNLEVEVGDKGKSTFSAAEVNIQLDLMASLLALEPKVENLSVNGLVLDISGISLIRSDNDETGKPEPDAPRSNPILKQLEQLLLRQMEDFSLTDSRITYRSFAEDVRQIQIEELKWHNRGENHKLEGVVGLVGSEINSLGLIGNFDDHGSLLDVSGDFYLQARNIKVKPWLTRYLRKETGIESGQISFNSWLTLKHSKPVDAYAEMLPSELVWKDGSEHVLTLEQGIFSLLPSLDENSFLVSGNALRVSTDAQDWPELDLAFSYDPQQWRLNLSQLDIRTLLPLVHLLPDSDAFTTWINRLNPGGRLEDIRLAQGKDVDSLRYSASLHDGAMQQWDLLPELHALSADIAGTLKNAHAHIELQDDTVPYGDVFQAPLNIKQVSADLIWQSDDTGWRLWSDKVTGETPDLQVQGAFRLDMPDNASPFLSVYAETDLYHAGETWRYLPKRALGQTLTDFLSAAIQGGRADTAQILWYGALDRFPYNDNSGVFQASVGLKEARFSFDTAWPPITDLQLDLLFENESMYLDSYSARLMDVTAKRITGQIPRLHPDSRLEIKAVATGKGEAVRHYMTASPLVDSVGAALTAVQVSGNVYSEFQLDIPLSGEEVRAWGYAQLPGNHIEIDAPPMVLEKAKGKITFDNDVVGTSGLSALLLDQPISVDFSGEQRKAGYMVDIDVIGDWEAQPLIPHVGEKWLGAVKGHAPWSTAVDLQLNDVGFTYQIDTRVNLEFVASQYPQPLTKALGKRGEARLQASGNQESISGRIQLPGVKYQAEIDITGARPVLTATNLLVGEGGFKVSPVVGNDLTIRTKSFNLDDWISFIAAADSVQDNARLSQMNTPDIPYPDRIIIATDTLTLATLDWHDVKVNARKKSPQWQIRVSSAEANGQASYLEPYDLSVVLDNLHLNVPALAPAEDEEEQVRLFEADEDWPLVSDFDRSFRKLMPNLTLNINDFWLQGYKVGSTRVELLRKNDRLEWKNIEFSSGKSRVQGSGWWILDGDQSHSQFSLHLEGENNSELMERFGISSGIQKAPFDISSELSWQGAPWSVQVDTLNGEINSEFGKGIISDVSGAARLLGLFSLDSIIRKMQLDFSDVFDDGLAFDSITGSGKIKDGVFVTNNIEMDAVAGDMTIRGMADLNQRLVDAEVEFIPDLTSGLPVLTAFAITPQTAVLVYAVSKVISPVVDVFTQIRYQVKGPLSNPEVTELSRSRGEYTLPEEQRQKIKGLK